MSVMWLVELSSAWEAERMKLVCWRLRLSLSNSSSDWMVLGGSGSRLVGFFRDTLGIPRSQRWVQDRVMSPGLSFHDDALLSVKHEQTWTFTWGGGPIRATLLKSNKVGVALHHLLQVWTFHVKLFTFVSGHSSCCFSALIKSINLLPKQKVDFLNSVSGFQNFNSVTAVFRCCVSVLCSSTNFYFYWPIN